MSLCFGASAADGTEIYLGGPDASCNIPVIAWPAKALSITAGATATTAGSNSITTLATPANTYIEPAHATLGGWFLEFVAPGSEVGLPAELTNTAAIVNGATSLAVRNLPLAIPASSVAQWPVPVRGATTRNYAFNVAQIQSQASDKTGFAASVAGQITSTIDLTIEISESAGYYNIRRLAGKRETGYLKIVYPQANTAIRPEIIEGIVYFSQLQKTAQDNNIQTMTVTAGFVRRPTESYGLAA